MELIEAKVRILDHIFDNFKCNSMVSSTNNLIYITLEVRLNLRNKFEDLLVSFRLNGFTSKYLFNEFLIQDLGDRTLYIVILIL